MGRQLEDPKLLDNVIAQRARRLGISEEQMLAEAEQHPETVRVLTELAAARGVSPVQILRDVMSNLPQVNYPGPECLLPHEFASLVDKGELPSARADHLRQCEPCRALAGRLKPSAEKVLQFKKALKERKLRQREQSIVEAYSV